MREIKFRAWSILNAKMLSWADIFHLPAWEIFPGTPEQRAFIVMQYTGLKDNNGKEIYEGDILTWGNNIIAKVYYADDLAVFRCVVEGTEEFDLFAFNQEASILGNIYENKELLDE